MVINQSYFSRQTTEHLKGFLAIAVLLHHIYQKTAIISHDSLAGFFCQSVGYYCVSMFFFISGYGLMKSLSKKREGYLSNYQRNRVLPIFLINALLVLIYSITKTCLGIEVTPINMTLSLFYGGTIVGNGWYLLCIMVFYELFYISAKLNIRHVAATVLVLTLAYIVVAFKMPTWYTVSSLAFPAGVFFCEYKDRLDHWLKDNLSLAFLSVGASYIICFVTLFFLNHNILPNIPGRGLIKYGLSLIHGIFLSGVLILILTQVGDSLQKETKIKQFLTQNYLELYVMQGLAFILLRNPMWGVENDWIFLISSIAITLVLAVVVHPIFNQIIVKVKAQKNG